MYKITIGTIGKVKSLSGISQDLWGKDGTISDIREWKPQERDPLVPEWLHNRTERWAKKNTPTLYFLRFFEPCRMTGIWLEEHQIEQV